jgi:hypothetical protein
MRTLFRLSAKVQRSCRRSAVESATATEPQLTEENCWWVWLGCRNILWALHVGQWTTSIPMRLKPLSSSPNVTTVLTGLLMVWVCLEASPANASCGNYVHRRNDPAAFFATQIQQGQLRSIAAVSEPHRLTNSGGQVPCSGPSCKRSEIPLRAPVAPISLQVLPQDSLLGDQLHRPRNGGIAGELTFEDDVPCDGHPQPIEVPPELAPAIAVLRAA